MYTNISAVFYGMYESLSITSLCAILIQLNRLYKQIYIIFPFSDPAVPLCPFHFLLDYQAAPFHVKENISFLLFPHFEWLYADILTPYNQQNGQFICLPWPWLYPTLLFHFSLSAYFSCQEAD